MGKKVRAKARNPRKVHARAHAGSAQTVDPNEEEIAGFKTENGDEICSHYGRSSVELSQILLGIIATSNEPAACENCREEPSSGKRSGKEKRGKQLKKKGAQSSEETSESGYNWACLDCGRCYCGGAVRESVPYGHSRRHSNQERHPWAARVDDPSVAWCFLCSSGFHLDLPEVASDAEDVKSSAKENTCENGFETSKMGDGSRPVVRGLSNLGNTCFFNSVMQNLFALDTLRGSMVNLDRPIGPLTMALKKLFVETSGVAEAQGVLSPKNLFSAICSKLPQFRGYQQQDSHELLRCLLDSLHDEEVSARKSDSSGNEEVKTSESTLVDSIFSGKLSSTVCCAECGYTSTVFEPFLDLSLPVPSKRPSPKKIPPPPKKPVLKDRSKSRRFRGKETDKGSLVLEEQTTESTVSVSKPDQTIVRKEYDSTENNVALPASDQENIGPEMLDVSWMDYLDEPSTSLVDMNADIGKIDDSTVQDSGCGDSDKTQKPDDMHSCAESQVNNMSKELIMSQNSCEENCSKDEVDSFSVQELGVILHPREEINAGKEVMSLPIYIHNPHNTCSTAESSSKLSMQESTLASCGQEESGFEGFCDLFNEPEVTSDVKGPTSMTEDIHTTFLANKYNDSSQEEVDDTNNPVSVNSCLALFTKPELLTGDHAWYCERCSEVSSHEVNGKKEKVHPDVIGSLQEMKNIELKSVVPLSFKSESKSSGSADVTSTSDLFSNSELPSAFEKAINGFEGSGGVTYGNGEAARDSGLTSTFCDGPHSLNLITENLDTLGSDSIRTTVEISAGMKGDLAVKEDAMSSRQAQEDPSKSLPCSVSIVSNSSRNCNCEDNGVQRRRSKRLDQFRRVKDIKVASKETENSKVKRDATKRILINRPPLVLTIHLKRFSQDARGRLTKLKGHVFFQETLDLRPYLDPRCEEKEKCTYRLVGVVEHSGSMSGGHYVAYVRGEMGKAKMQKDNSSPYWFYASDAYVSSTSLSEVLQSEAYILFYERV